MSDDLNRVMVLHVDNEDEFDVEVVGESFHQRELRKVDRGRLEAGERYVESVILIPEPDNQKDPNAIAVLMRGAGQLGYLPRETAAVYAPVLGELWHHDEAVSCPARFAGGTPAKPSIGVWLDLPAPADLAAALPAARSQARPLMSQPATTQPRSDLFTGERQSRLTLVGRIGVLVGVLLLALATAMTVLPPGGRANDIATVFGGGVLFIVISLVAARERA